MGGSAFACFRLAWALRDERSVSKSEYRKRHRVLLVPASAARFPLALPTRRDIPIHLVYVFWDNYMPILLNISSLPGA
jgi:hypothetical protein